MRPYLRASLVPLLCLAMWSVLAPVFLSGCTRHEQKAASKFYCPMHPTYITDHMGDCPICNMKLIPMPETRPSTDSPTHDTPAVVGDVELTPEQVELAGVRTAPVTRGALGQSVRAVGSIKANERLTRTITMKAAGYVERLFVNTTGQIVRAGEPIVELYSPELLAAQEEYVNARGALARVRDAASTEAQASAERLLSAARRRLELLDVPSATIERLDAGGAAARTVSLTTPWSGFVTTKSVTEGARMEAGSPLFTVTDLSSVWIEASFYESEASLLRVGRSAEISLAGERGPTRSAEIVFVSPTLDPATRTLVARFELANRDLALKPGMFADVTLAGDASEGLLVPSDAVLDTGTRQIVYVAVSDRRFQPRVVVMGRRGQGMAEILSGLSEGERVVTGATFLLDSESRIRAAAGGMTHGEGH